MAITRGPASDLLGNYPHRIAALDDAAALGAALADCAVVIHCAGPFTDTAAPLVAAALAAGCHFLDVSAEQASTQALYAHWDSPARAAGLAVIPAAGFYGGLADLLATALLPAGSAPAQHIRTLVGLDHWWPTQGTRITGARNQVPRLQLDDGQLVPLQSPPATLDWIFAEPLGPRAMVALPFSEIITMARHLRARRIDSYLDRAALAELREAGTRPPPPGERSPQRFAMDVLVTDATGTTQRAGLRGQDIYASSAPLLVEAAIRLRDEPPVRGGALALGECVPAIDFLRAFTAAADATLELP
jgi:short subunit dehydrogenase-like uncharacterized protein